MHRPMWEKGGNFYGLHRSIQGTYHVYFQRLLQSCHTLCHYQRMARQEQTAAKRNILVNTSQKKSSPPLSTSDEYFKAPYEEHPVTICGQTIILTNGELATALLSLPEKKREIIYLYFFGHYTQQEIGEMYGSYRNTAWHHILHRGEKPFRT